MSRDRLDFLGALLWYLARAAAVLFVAIRLVTYINDLEQRGQTQHEQMMREHRAFMQHHEKLLRDHDAQATEHRAILQHLAR